MFEKNKIQELIDRQEIYDVLTRYCQGVDRCDVDLIKSVYHEDAQDDHGMFKGRGLDFAEWIVDWEKENAKHHTELCGDYWPGE